jgi:predicted  nucleic acid-binding Zn-ribbon protein
VQKIIRPELARLYDSLADMKEAMMVKVENDNKQLQAEIAKLKATDAAKTKQLEALVKEFTFQGKDLTTNLERLKAQMDFELGNMTSTNDAAKQAMAKMRKAITDSVQEELAKLKGLDTNIKYEFSRINSLFNKSVAAMKLLMEDQMIMQMMQEQEIIDRK